MRWCRTLLHNSVDTGAADLTIVSLPHWWISNWNAKSSHVQQSCFQLRRCLCVTLHDTHKDKQDEACTQEVRPCNGTAHHTRDVRKMQVARVKQTSKNYKASCSQTSLPIRPSSEMEISGRHAPLWNIHFALQQAMAKAHAS